MSRSARETAFDTLIHGQSQLSGMSDVARLRDSTQILLPSGTLDGLRSDLEEQFTVTVHRDDQQVKIVGSPVEIKMVSDFLARNGVTVA